MRWIHARRALLVVLPIVLAGCGPAGPQRTIVSGTVTYNGQPLPRAQIRFVPVKGSGLPVSGAQIIDGRYTVDRKGGVPVGTHTVWIEAFRERSVSPRASQKQGQASTWSEVPLEQYLPEKYHRKSELRLTISPDSGSITRDFDLTL